MYRGHPPLPQSASSKMLLARDKAQLLPTPARWQQADLVPELVTRRKEQAWEEAEQLLPGASVAAEQAAAPLPSPGSSRRTSVSPKSCRNLVRIIRKRRGS